MKKILVFIICFIFVFSSCTSDENEASSVPENSGITQGSEIEKESPSSVPEIPAEKDEPEEEESSTIMIFPEKFDHEKIPENNKFIKIEVCCFTETYCYALTDSGNLYRYNYVDESMECVKTGVKDFWCGNFYEIPNIIFDNGWVSIREKLFYKPNLVAVAGNYFLTENNNIEYYNENEWHSLEVNAKKIKTQVFTEIFYIDNSDNLFRFNYYIEDPLFLAENVSDFDYNYFDKINYADETIYITTDGDISIIFDKEFSNPEKFLSQIPKTAEKVYSSSGNFLFQKEDGTYLFGHKNHDRNRNIDIRGTAASLLNRNYAILGTDGNIYLHIEELTYFGEAVDEEYTVIKDFVIELP